MNARIKKFGLLMCVGGSNTVLEETSAFTQRQAIAQLSPRCPVTLNEEGYAKISNTTYTVAEYFHNGVGA